MSVELKSLDLSQFKPIRLPSGKYFINDQGTVLSYTQHIPRIIKPNQKLTREYFVILYCPRMMLFNVAELVLTTFERKPKKSESICYKDFDVTNIKLENLFWGDPEAQAKHSITANLKLLSSNTKTAEESKEHTIYCVNKVMLKDLLTISVKLSQLNASGVVVPQEMHAFRQFYTGLSEIMDKNVISENKLMYLMTFEFITPEVKQVVKELDERITKHKMQYEKH